jgi:hypothetical protein
MVQHIQLRSCWVQMSTLGQEFLHPCLGLSVLGLFNSGQGIVLVIEVEQEWGQVQGSHESGLHGYLVQGPVEVLFPIGLDPLSQRDVHLVKPEDVGSRRVVGSKMGHKNWKMSILRADVEVFTRYPSAESLFTAT